MIVIGLTGNLASGKSEAARLFKKLGAKVFDADRAAKNAARRGTPIYKAIVKIFGAEYLDKNRQLDRKKLAWHVFSHPKELKKLDVLIHPGVIFESFKMIERTRDQKGVLVLDVPLLFESKMENLTDFTVVVGAQRSTLLARAKKKGLPENLAKKILSTQWPFKRKVRLADFVIENNGTFRDLEKKVREIFEKIKSTKD